MAAAMANLFQFQFIAGIAVSFRYGCKNAAWLIEDSAVERAARADAGWRFARRPSGAKEKEEGGAALRRRARVAGSAGLSACS
jgi:hypothetical protein